jgi:hypothetical protein
MITLYAEDELSDAPREATFPMITYALPAGLQL